MPQLRHRSADRIQGRYEVHKLLGSGAYGTVYGCRDLEIDVPVAVKEMHVLDERPGEREAALSQFRAEATHLSRLRHPHIVSGHYEPYTGNWQICPVCGLDFPGQVRCPDHGAPLAGLSSRHYLVMEYIDGPDLMQLATQEGGKIGIGPLLHYAGHIAGALAHIHARGFVHRDIKPENIRIRADSDEAVLLDFGIATSGDVSGDRYGTRAQRHTQGGGTVGYAPESMDERRKPDARSDIHAFGMTLYHLSTGRDPTEIQDLQLMRSHTPRDFEPGIPARLDALIMSCIDARPENRPQDGAELLERLENLSRKAPVAAPFAAANPQIVNPTTILSPPVAPLTFRSGHQAHDIAELSLLIDEIPDDVTRKLFNGEIENWLNSLGEREVAIELNGIRQRYRGRPAQGLEALAQATGMLAKPSIELSPPSLNFGSLNGEAHKTIDLRLLNRGRGHLFGLIRASHPAVSTYGEWDGNKARVPVTFDANRLRPGRYVGEVVLDSSAGEVAVPFAAQVRGPSWLVPFLVVLIYGAGGMVSGALLRTLPFIYSESVKSPGWNWIGQGTTMRWWPTAPLFGLAVWIVLFSWTTIESIFRRSCSLWLGMGLLGSFAAVAAGLFGLELLKAGDAALWPVGAHNLNGFAAGGWMFAGALLGAFCGSLRRYKDLLSVRAGAVALGWVATLVLIYIALSGVFAGMERNIHN